MKNIKRILTYTFILIIALSFSFVTVRAEEEITGCTVEKDNVIRQKANAIRVNYVPVQTEEKKVTDGNEESLSKRFIDIKIYNVTSDVFLNFRSNNEKVTVKSETFDYQKIGPDGSITIRIPALSVVAEYIIDVYSYSEACNGEIIRTIRVTIPKYNFFSQLEACNGAEDFYMCQEYITFDIDSDKFYEQIASYKENGGQTADDLLYKNNTKNILAKSSNFKYFVVGLIVACGAVATYYIVKKTKKDNEKTTQF
jgi:hypothetical protein